MRIPLFFVFIFLSSLALAQTKTSERLTISFSLFESLRDGNGEKAHALLDSSVRQKTSPGQLNGLWRQVAQSLQMGEFQDTNGYLLEENTLYLGMVFEKGELDFKVSFTKQNTVTSFLFTPPIDKRAYILPSYADTSTFIEQNFTLISGKYKLAGKLCIPKSKGPHPLCILSHGSGPNEMDEKMGPNRVFKDIAYGLASQGIAVFRFNKRTAVYGGQSAEDPEKLTLNDEYLEDLYAAIDTFATHPEIHADKMYLLGHSLGGYIAPRVAANTDKLKGIILAGAPCRHLDSIALEQITYLNSIDTSGTYYRPLKNIKEEVAYLRSGDFDLDSDPNWLPLGLNAYYWADLLAYDPVKTLKTHPIQTLILNGEDDYQVNMHEFSCWKQRLSTQKKIYYHSFKGLGHGFFSSEGILGPAQYQNQHEVDEAVIKEIKVFIQQF